MNKAILALEDVTVAYHGDITILNRVSVQVRQSQVHRRDRPQRRAGKSTVLKTLFGFLPPCTGRITLRGDDISAQPSFERARHGAWPSCSSIAACLASCPCTTTSCWAAGRSAYDRARVRARIDSVYDHFSILVQKRNDPISSMSGGQQRFVEFGLALGDPVRRALPPCSRSRSSRKSIPLFEALPTRL